MARRHVPVRTCVGCRAKAAKSDLLRVVIVGGVLVPDEAGCMQGRGAYLHRDSDCLALAERRRAIPRALRLTGPPDVCLVRNHLEGQVGASTPEAPATEMERMP